MPLHLQAQAFLEMLAADPPPGWHELSPAAGREVFNGLQALFGEALPVNAIENHELENGVRLRIYRPAAAGLLPAVMYFHGGGWVLGNIETHDSLCRALCNETQAAVVSVNYRCAPEYKYPLPLEDCYRATQYVADRAPTLNIDGQRIAVAGDSAGGNLAAALCLKARDEQGPAICHQTLIYPITSYNLMSPSYVEFEDGFGLTKTSMAWFWKQYLAEDEAGAEAYASPLVAERLTGLPAATVVTAEYDVLRDEGEAYAAKLRQAGVPVELQRYDGQLHGFVHFRGAFDAGHDALDYIASQLRLSFQL